MFFLLAITLSIAAPFFDVPSLKESGALKYYSSLFIAERPKDGVIKIHGGTLFDYVFVFDRSWNGKQRTTFVLQQYMEGLLTLIEEFENSSSDDLTIKGTSYIINQRTAERVGFSVTDIDYIQKLSLMYNYFSVTLSHSIAKGKLSFPKISETKTFEAKLSELRERKEYIRTMHSKLSRTSLDRIPESTIIPESL